MSRPPSEIERLTGGLMEEGWGGLAPDQARISADVRELMSQARLEAEPIAQLFDTPQGQRVLLWLIGKTLLRPPSLEMQAATTAEAYALAAARREGQNAVVWMIISALQVAHGEQASAGGEQ